MRRDTLTRKTGTRAGRPSSLTPQRADTIIKYLRAGNHINTACHYAGVSTDAFYRWLRRAERADFALETGAPYNPDDTRFRTFRDDVLRARAEAAATMVGVVFNAAEGGQLILEEPALDGAGNPIRDEDGRVIMKRQWSQPNGNLALAYLKVAQRAEYGGGPQQIEVSGPGGVALTGGAGDEGGIDGDQVSAVARAMREAMDRQRELGVGPSALTAGAVQDESEIHDAQVVDEEGNPV